MKPVLFFWLWALLIVAGLAVLGVRDRNKMVRRCAVVDAVPVESMGNMVCVKAVEGP